MLAMFSLNKQVALVTGATGHLGKAMVETLAQAGAKVYVNGRNVDKVTVLVKQLADKGYCVQPAIFDVTQPDQVTAFFAHFSEEKLNILVNNAYAGGGGTIESATDEAYIASYHASVVAAQRLLKLSLPFMRRAIACDINANCINIGSMYGMVSPEQAIYGEPHNVNPPFYGAAKAALIQWTKYAASELAKENIRVNCISPGAFPSPQAQNNAVLMDALKHKIPVARFGQPEELQGGLLYLASKASSYVTGHNLVIDGGWTIR